MSLNSSVLYPTYSTHQVSNSYGYRWQELVRQLTILPATDPKVIAFALMIRRLRREAGLSTRVDLMCTLNASEAIQHYQGGEDDLLRLYRETLHEVNRSVASMSQRSHQQIA